MGIKVIYLELKMVSVWGVKRFENDNSGGDGDDDGDGIRGSDEFTIKQHNENSKKIKRKCMANFEFDASTRFSRSGWIGMPVCFESLKARNFTVLIYYIKIRISKIEWRVCDCCWAALKCLKSGETIRHNFGWICLGVPQPSRYFVLSPPSLSLNFSSHPSVWMTY